jgi:hypothetical protein
MEGVKVIVGEGVAVGKNRGGGVKVIVGVWLGV